VPKRRLQLNALKRELQWLGSRANLRKLSANPMLSVGNDVIQPVKVARDLSVYLYDNYDDDNHDWVRIRQVCLKPGAHVK